MKRRVRLGPVGEFVRRRIAATRTSLGLTQKDLGERAGLPGNTISEIENGARRIDVDDIAAIARALDVDVPYLLGAEHQRNVDDDGTGTRTVLAQLDVDEMARAIYESSTAFQLTHEKPWANLHESSRNAFRRQAAAFRVLFLGKAGGDRG